MALTLHAFVARWQSSGAEERANKDLFFAELCDALDVPRPNPKTGDPALDTYVFEKDVQILHEGGTTSIGRVDLYKEGHLLVEAKQGKGDLSKKLGSAKRGTPAWNVAMADAYGQALGYARTLDRPPPFLVTADIGYCFDLYASFDGTASYRPFPNPMATRLFFADLDKHANTLRRIFLDPHGLDPAQQAAKVTREVAAHLAELAKALEEAGHPSEAVATFLMRCLFTMFAEDVNLLPPRLFTDAIEKLWLKHPASFPAGIEALWQAMNTGTTFGFVGKLLRFNGGLFAKPTALPLTRAHLSLLLEAAKCNWADVEPAIFGTLLERALDPTERHALGAHYTPRAYVERLVRPTIEEPLRADWELVQAEVRQLVVEALEAGGVREALSAAELLALGKVGAKRVKKTRIGQEGARIKKLNEARAVVHAFHKKLTSTRVLDPACGSGNFLYVTLDLFQRLEGEVLAALEGLGDKQELLHADAIRVTPGQFFGIEVKRWAKEIAELVLWIGYLQHHFQTYGKTMPVPEPVLEDYKNIVCRDAVLDWDGAPVTDVVRDEKGKPVARWDGVTYKKSPVTGEDVPNEKATIPVYDYPNPRKATWPKVDFVVGNPPFIGNKRMRLLLGDGYVEALRRAHRDVPESADLVMYWWNHAATLVDAGKLQRFGLITTNSITQGFNKRVVARHTEHGSLVFVTPDHPWVDTHGGAQVRIAMTVFSQGRQIGRLQEVTTEEETADGEHLVQLSSRTGEMNADLRIGANLSGLVKLRSNRGLSCPGVQLSSQGFVVSVDRVATFSPSTRTALVRLYLTGRDLTQASRTHYVIDTFGLSERDLKVRFPDAYQWLLDHVKPERAHNPRPSYSKKWWLHSEPRSKFRAALAGLPRFIGTSRTARHRTFQFLASPTLPETKVLIIALDDASHYGVISSRAHVVFATATGGWLGVGNDSTYNHSTCFDPFPFPAWARAHEGRVRNLGEQLDDHHKRQQAQYPDLTITGMYNVLAKLRSGEPLVDKDKIIHQHGLVSILKQIHDDLDAAVFDAYGWPHDLTDEQVLEKLVALNAERAEEERKGNIRWLRPDFQNPRGTKAATQEKLVEIETDEAETAGEAAWPKKLPEQVAAVRDLILRDTSAWSSKTVAQACKGVGAKGVEPVLESLAALGLVVAYDVEGERRWKAARAT